MVPTELRSRVLSNAHEAHQGLVRTKQRLRDKFWWTGIDGDAWRHCCETAPSVLSTRRTRNRVALPYSRFHCRKGRGGR